VYWRRRIVAATGVALLLVVIFFLATSPGGSGDGSSTSTSDSPAPTVSADAAAETVTGAACAAADVQLTLTPNPLNFAAGALPTFDVAIKNSGATACTLDTTADGTEFAIWSGGESNKDVYFSTAYCADDATVSDLQWLLDTGAQESMKLTWSRQRTGEGCTIGDAPADGFYWAQVTIQGISSDPAQFQLSS